MTKCSGELKLCRRRRPPSPPCCSMRLLLLDESHHPAASHWEQEVCLLCAGPGFCWQHRCACLQSAPPPPGAREVLQRICRCFQGKGGRVVRFWLLWQLVIFPEQGDFFLFFSHWEGKLSKSFVYLHIFIKICLNILSVFRAICVCKINISPSTYI